MKTMTMPWCTLIVACAIVASLSPAALAGVATFDDLALPPASYWNGSDGTGGFASGGLQFANIYTPAYGSWEGWAYSNMSDTLTPGYGNQYSAITGGGCNGSSNYGVAYQGFAGVPAVSFPSAATVQGAYFTNTTYAYLSMRDGDSFAKKFGGTSGNDPDWFLLTITGKDSTGAVTGTKDFYLADYRFANNAQDYIANQWTWVDLTGLGGSVRSLQFSLNSSDVGPFGMNTPAYFAVDNLTVLPEPAALCLLLSAVGALVPALVRRVWRSRSTHGDLPC